MVEPFLRSCYSHSDSNFLHLTVFASLLSYNILSVAPYFCRHGWDSSACIATPCSLDAPGFEFRWVYSSSLLYFRPDDGVTHLAFSTMATGNKAAGS
jgi:hypothetical protein